MRSYFSSSLLLLLLSIVPYIVTFHFYLEGAAPKCFVQEVPKDTLVVGHFKAEEYSSNTNSWVENHDLAIQITVNDNINRIVNQRGVASGRFSFTSNIAGVHVMCFQTNSTSWWGSEKIRLFLDIMIGEDGVNPTENKDSKINDMYWKIHDLNNKVMEVKREQQYQKEREAEFRDQSELTNARTVWWTIVQIVVLVVTCVWQLSHLKNFFIAKKLV